MRCCKCGTTEKKFISVMTCGKDIPTEYLCMHCEVTDARHSNCRIPEEQKQDPRLLSEREQEDCCNGAT